VCKEIGVFRGCEKKRGAGFSFFPAPPENRKKRAHLSQFSNSSNGLTWATGQMPAPGPPWKKEQLMRRYHDFDDDEGEYESDPEEELYNLLRDIDRHRVRLQAQTRLLHQLLEHNPDLKAEFEDFLRSGGLSREDFERFQDGTMRPRLLNHRGNLRLVSKSQPLVCRRRKPAPPDDAA
jgi:hypothetical protein